MIEHFRYDNYKQTQQLTYGSVGVLLLGYPTMLEWILWG
jgi:hypothetical protein